MSTPFEWKGEGWYPAIDANVYHADPAPEPSFSAGMAETMTAATPLHVWTDSKRLNPNWEAPEGRDAFDVGKAAHSFITGRGEPIYEVDADDWRKKDAKEARDKAREMGFTPLLTKHADKVRRMVAAARAQLVAHPDIRRDPFAEAEPEIGGFWRSDGVWNRMMVDGLDRKRRIAWDLKTHAGLADPHAWARRGIQMGADTRAAHYLDGLSTIEGGPWRYLFVVVEKDAPHGLSVLEMSETALEMGRRKHAHARGLFRECLERGVWPAWPAEITTVDPPAYEVTRWFDQESRIETRRNERPSRSLIDAAIQFQSPQ